MNVLPTNSKGRQKHSYTVPLFLSIPGIRSRRLRILIPNLPMLKRRRISLLVLTVIAVFFTFFTIIRHRGNGKWSDETSSEPPTLVFRKRELQKIWQWEIESGHYPSHASIPVQIGLTKSPVNPAIPRKPPAVKPTRYRAPSIRDVITDTEGVGPKRVYLDIQSHPPQVAYPPRPIPGSVADMDEIMRHCDFAKGKYVRDCLEVLRIGGGLDNGERLRRAKLDDWKYIYVEEADNSTDSMMDSIGAGAVHHDNDDDGELYETALHRVGRDDGVDSKANERDEGLTKKQDAEWEKQVSLGPTLIHRPANTLSNPCDPENPRIFHVFWTGAFTDKPYLAILSFLFTQNTGMHLPQWPSNSKICRPQFWLWVNPGPAAAVPNPNAVDDMFKQLKNSPWASPFLHPRFKDIIHFKMWNTTEQLDGIPEIKDEWRALQDSLFNSGGHIISVKKGTPSSTTTSKTQTTTEMDLWDDLDDEGNSTSTAIGGRTKNQEEEDDLENRTGSKSSSSYDRLSVILSDMARFVLCHKYGGVYLDADTILLRDWEELWGWKGAFAYRWSRLQKYNTAVLRMHKGSALGTFLFRTALKNGLDFHPMTVSRYTADAHLENLLLRLPDALFDSAWLNTENFQRDRPPQPYFTEFSDFFDTPAQNSAAPEVLGFRGFFRGAYSYHFHNFWWKPFDPTRNWPDLGPRFKAGEEVAKAQLLKDGKILPEDIKPGKGLEGLGDDVASDKRDLDWSIILKRTFEAYIRGERPNVYGEWFVW